MYCIRLLGQKLNSGKFLPVIIYLEIYSTIHLRPAGIREQSQSQISGGATRLSTARDHNHAKNIHQKQ